MTIKKLSLRYITIVVYILALEAGIRAYRQTFEIHENAVCHALTAFVMLHLNIRQGEGIKSARTWPCRALKRWECGGGSGGGDPWT